MNSATESGENAVSLGPTVLLSVFIGLGVIIITFLLKWIKQERSDKGSTKHDKPDKVKGSSADASGKHGKKEQAGAVKSSKKKLTDRETRRTARANEKGFSHPWLLATLKGHSGRVLDMDFSANGKYLVSCGDEDPDPGGVSKPNRRNHPPSSSDSSSVSSSESNKENSLPPSSAPSPVAHKGLSRRQRKNRKRDSHTPPAPHKSEQEPEQGKPEPTKGGKKGASLSPRAKHEKGADREDRAVKYGTRRQLELGARVMSFAGLDLHPLEEYRKMTMPEKVFIHILKDKYVLTKEAMAILGYPVRTELGGISRRRYEFHRLSEPLEFYYNHYLTGRRYHRLDVHAEEFIPKNDSGDSGHGSSSSSEEESSSGSEGVEEVPFPVPKLAPGTHKKKDERERVCVRCGARFITTHQIYVTLSECQHHPGKMVTEKDTCGPMKYNCCQELNGTAGCTKARRHVWPGPKEPVVNSSYVETEPPKYKRYDNNYGVYSLDCEMSYTVIGLEVVKVTLVDISGRPVYNEFVKPLNDIIDYNTMYSGIVEEDFVKHPTKSLVQVQQDLKNIISSETVLIGHGLENDLKGLKLIHKTVVDTAFTFPHFMGLPFKRSLKNLAEVCLNQQIQCGTKGHDSYEDARACMELMLFRLRKDFPNNF